MDEETPKDIPQNTDVGDEENDEGEVVSLKEAIDDQIKIYEDAAAVLGAIEDKVCSYVEGYMKRQALYACLTCIPEAVKDPSKAAGICLACCYHCHDGHDLLELYTKRNFRCDCGNKKFPNQRCTLHEDKEDYNDKNKYNQNFGGTYCFCSRPYPDPDDPIEDEMIQCIICEDWYHTRHLGAPVPDNYFEMICVGCIRKYDYLLRYDDLSISYANSISVNTGNSAATLTEKSSVEKTDGTGSMDEKTKNGVDENETADVSFVEDTRKEKIASSEFNENVDEKCTDRAIEDNANKSYEENAEERGDAEVIEEYGDKLTANEANTLFEENSSDRSSDAMETDEHEGQGEIMEVDGCNTRERDEGKEETVGTETEKQGAKNDEINKEKLNEARDLDEVGDKASPSPKVYADDEDKVEVVLDLCRMPPVRDDRAICTKYMQDGWRSHLCTCSKCLDMYAENDMSYITDPEDTVHFYEEKGKNKTKEYCDKELKQFQDRLQALDRYSMLETLARYNDFKEELEDFFKSFATNKRVIRVQDVEEFFANMRAKRQKTSYNTYYCR